MIVQGDVDAREFKRLFRAGFIRVAGNWKLHIYGQLNCRSGKRMKKSNRVFFTTRAEAEELGFRPCAHCMRAAYAAWKLNFLNSFHLSYQQDSG